MKFVKVKQEESKRYKSATVSQAIGKSESSINSFMSNRERPTKGGLTIADIEAFLEAPKRGEQIDWEGVKEIREALIKRGWCPVEDDDNNEQMEAKI